MTVPYVPFSPPRVRSNPQAFRSRQVLLVENLALRHQLSVLKRRNRRPKLAVLGELFWVLARRFWSDWKKSLLVVALKSLVWMSLAEREGFNLLLALVI